MSPKLRYDVSLKLDFAADVGREPVAVSLVVEPDTPLYTLREILSERAGILSDFHLTCVDFQPLRLKVTAGSSCYRPYLDGLDINIDEPIVQYFKKYRAEHHLLNCHASHSLSQIFHDQEYDIVDHKLRFKSEVVVGPARLKFRRTLRIPDDVEEYTLPPDLGTFPLVDVERFSRSPMIPARIKARGGYLMPMFQREALWIDFRDSGHCAVKVSVGEVNALTGEHRTTDGPFKAQDYITLPLQPWLDGICTSPGVVRQFVAAPLGYNYTIEEQIMRQTNAGGIQLDVFPSLELSVTCTLMTGRRIDITQTPRQLGIMEGDTILMKCSNFPPCRTVHDYVTRVSTNLSFHYFYDHNATELSLENMSLAAGDPGPDYDVPLGIAAGGQIKQNIYKDPRPVSLYDEERAERVWIHTVSTEMWERITGVVAPITPIVPEMYKILKYPWLDTFDEHLSTIPPTDGFQHIRTVGQLDARAVQDAFTRNKAVIVAPAPCLIDPDRPPRCTSHATVTASVVLRPCGHPACEACVGKILLRGKRCTSCGATAVHLVGFKKPVPNVMEDGEEDAVWEIDGADAVEMDEEPVDATVTTFVLAYDRVASLVGVDHERMR